MHLDHLDHMFAISGTRRYGDSADVRLAAANAMIESPESRS